MNTPSRKIHWSDFIVYLARLDRRFFVQRYKDTTANSDDIARAVWSAGCFIVLPDKVRKFLLGMSVALKKGL